MTSQNAMSGLRNSLILGTLLGLSAACASTPQGPVAWPDTPIETAPAGDPEEEARFERGDDGLLYVVGGEQLKVGQAVFGRYDGVWPLQGTAPPALFVGQVVENAGAASWRVHPLYIFPETDVIALQPALELADGEPESMGKGVGELTSIDYSGPTHLGVNLGGIEGVQQGDMYLVLRNPEAEGVPAGQLTRRLLGVCMIVEVEAETSTCRLRVGHHDYGWAGTINEGDQLLFAEPSFGKAPAEAVIYISPVEGRDELNAKVVAHLQAYIDRMPGARVRVEPFDASIDAADENFHRWGSLANSNELPAMLLGVSVVDRDGEEHLVLNYTGLSPALGSGMVAAPPEGGVDMGPIDALGEEAFGQVGATVLGALMVYRGQNAEALMHLHDALRSPGLQGPWRWHVRDQYAMRWGALGHFDEALWLVLQDEAIARAESNERARLNALGTRVRLLDFLEQPEAALAASEAYLQARQDERPGTSYLSALSMNAEMLAGVGNFGRVREIVDEIVELCPDACQGDAIGLLAGIYWASMDDPELTTRIVGEMLTLSTHTEDNAMASVRMFQGWTAMGERELEQALIAFLEAERLFEEEGSTYGQARANLYIAIVQIGRDEPQDAFERGMAALETMTRLGDYGSTVQVYEYLSGLYADIDPSQPPQPYLGGAVQVLQGNLQAKLATGSFGDASEAAFSLANFLFRVGQLEDAENLFKRAVTLGLRSTRFDICALSHLFLGLAARAQGDMEGFQDEVLRARLMSELAEDPMIDELINNLLSPSDGGGDDVPTQML
ncbi:hypothetical protein DV096_04710 [Bradymonadaceae bacterium TMQ3]|nr:hypothetical protein DV096_04710 [Bradymonadaceae bacterium TMQ3]TXC77386.1 hypothetical protein FRC91_01225 [Bradymonadales bacterium TMQ1]